MTILEEPVREKNMRFDWINLRDLDGTLRIIGDVRILECRVEGVKIFITFTINNEILSIVYDGKTIPLENKELVNSILKLLDTTMIKKRLDEQRIKEKQPKYSLEYERLNYEKQDKDETKDFTFFYGDLCITIKYNRRTGQIISIRVNE